jgi:zeaxanthin glucosyltransferase
MAPCADDRKYIKECRRSASHRAAPRQPLPHGDGPFPSNFHRSRLSRATHRNISMARIVFKIYPAFSHCNATLGVARQLRARGHDVVYAGVPEMERYVRAQGFDFIIDADTASHPLHGRHQVRPTLGQKIRRRRALRQMVTARRREIMRANTFDRLVKNARPDILLVDAHYAPFCISLFRLPVQWGIFSTKVALDRAPGRPPIESAVVPRPTFASKIQCALAWKWYFLRRRIAQATSFGTFPTPAVIAAAARKAGAAAAGFDFDRCLIMGLSDVPEFILAPREFDFPRIAKPHQRYVGPSIDFERKETCYDAAFASAKARLFDVTDPRPLVYCSLGSLPWQYHGVSGFFSRLIAASTGQPWRLVIATGPDFERRDFARLPSNVSLFQHVPQLEILPHARLMVTHGGVNSITECIHSGVPMLVYPGSSDIDQQGNAARVIYHRLGLRGDLGRDSAATIGGKISAVLDSPEFPAAVVRLRCAIRGSEAFRDGAAVVERAFNLAVPHEHELAR